MDELGIYRSDLLDADEEKNEFIDSYVDLFFGSRGGGKSASATGESIIQTLLGRTIFSIFPIDFAFRWPISGHTVHYQSQVFDPRALLSLDKKLSKAIIYWDEMDKWLFARDFNRKINKNMSLILTLLRKEELSMLITCQYLSMLERNVRLQIDGMIRCTDLSFKYSRLRRGAVIGQVLQDMSGRYTGDMYEFSEQLYQRTFYAKNIWGTYDTKYGREALADALDFKELSLQSTRNQDDQDEPDLSGAGGMRFGEPIDRHEQETIVNETVIRHLVTELTADDNKARQDVINSKEFWNQARFRGFTGASRYWGNFLAGLGVVRRGRDSYYLPKGMNGADLSTAATSGSAA